MLKYCNYGKHLVIEKYMTDGGMCHYCLKLAKWRQSKEPFNTYAEVLRNGHWKAYLNSDSPLPELIASGHIHRDLYNSPSLPEILKSNVEWSIKKQYTPNEKYLFSGELRRVYFNIKYDDVDLGVVLHRHKSPNRLPTLHMKATEWAWWYPKVDEEDPQLSDYICNTFQVYYGSNSEPVNTSVIQYLPKEEEIYRPHRFSFLQRGRFVVHMSLKKKDNPLKHYYADFDVEI